MNILILSVTAGFGHNSTAAALSSGLQAGNATVTVLDIYKYLNEAMYQAIDKGYLISSKYTPGVYRTFYTKLEKKEHSAHNPITMLNTWLAFKFEKYLEDLKPDVIVCTHIFAARIINELKARSKITVPVIGIITDYTIHPYWESVPQIDYIDIASPLLKYRAVQRGIPAEHIVSFGIPINPKFSNSMTKTEARRELSIPEDRKTILVMCGSMGYGKMNILIRNIVLSGSSYTVLAVCGNNTKQFKKLEHMKNSSSDYDNLHIFGFVNNVDIMMDASDCIVTKPGGLTVSEALEKKLPMVLVSPIPGQEERNTEFLLNNGVALNVTDTFDVDEALHYIFHQPERLESMKKSIEFISCRNATKNLSEFISSLNTNTEG